tara:strand:- start:163 stop:810 length:648 start_codon:yes stop_codon:yes gene_type:complete
MSNVRIGISPHFYAATHLLGKMVMNSYHINVQLVTVTDDHIDQNIALERIKYIINEQFADSVLIDQEEKEAIKLYENAGVKVIPFPVEPVDQIIGLALYCKFSSIIEDKIAITDLDITSTAAGVSYLHGEDEPIGPFEVDGWWSNAEPECTKQKKPRSKKVVSLPTTETWKSLGYEWEEDHNPEDVTIEVVLDTKSKPKTESRENVVEFKPNDKK